MEPDWPLISADHCNSATPIQTYELELLSEEETLKSMQRLSLAKALRKMDMLTGKNKNIGRLISQHQEKLAHDRDVLKRKRRDDIVGGVLDDVIDGIFSVSDSGSSSDSVGYDTELSDEILESRRRLYESDSSSDSNDEIDIQRNDLLNTIESAQDGRIEMTQGELDLVIAELNRLNRLSGLEPLEPALASLPGVRDRARRALLQDDDEDLNQQTGISSIHEMAEFLEISPEDQELLRSNINSMERLGELEPEPEPSNSNTSSEGYYTQDEELQASSEDEGSWGLTDEQMHRLLPRCSVVVKKEENFKEAYLNYETID